jgi:hypothetical protein
MLALQSTILISPLFLGFNIKRYPHITHSHIYRWLNTLGWDKIDENENELYGILPIKISQVPAFILMYSAKPASHQTLPCNDERPAPGDYTAIDICGKLHHNGGR